MQDQVERYGKMTDVLSKKKLWCATVFLMPQLVQGHIFFQICVATLCQDEPSQLDSVSKLNNRETMGSEQTRQFGSRLANSHTDPSRTRFERHEKDYQHRGQDGTSKDLFIERTVL